MFTANDIRNHSAMAFQQKKIYRRNVLLSRAPHIGTNTVVTIGRCVDEYSYEDPVYVPPHDDVQAETRRDVVDWAVFVKWEFTANACENVISCNPYFPTNAKCKNLPGVFRSSSTRPPDGEGSEIDEPFSFRDAKTDQRFDACQPVCYDPAAAANNYVGLFTRFGRALGAERTITKGVCFVTDPLLLAYYLDPGRRVLDTKKDVLEDSAFYVTQRTIGVPPKPALVARLPPTYCQQYGLDFVEDVNPPTRGLVGSGVLYTCSQDESLFSLSTVMGTVMARAAKIGLYKAVKNVSPKSLEVGRRLEPTREHLKNETSWKANVVEGKTPLPFPLKSSDLGIVVGTKTEWLLWTDAYSHLDDGRNDAYGGRLIERDVAVPLNARLNANVRRSARDWREETRRKKRGVVTVDGYGRREEGDGEAHRREVHVLKAVESSVARYRSMVQRNGFRSLFHGRDVIQSMTDQLAGQSVLDLYSKYSESVVRAVKSSLKGGAKIHADSLGYTLANASLTASVEHGVVVKTAELLKKVIRAPKTVAGVLQLIGFLGFAVDLFSVIIYDPLNRYKHHFSDRALLALAEAELQWNARVFGNSRVTVDPYDWVVNTPYYDFEEELKVSLQLLPAMMQARSVNSEGGLLKRSTYSYMELSDDGKLAYSADGHKVSLDDTDAVVGAIGETIVDTTGSARLDYRGGETRFAIANGALYYVVVLFVVTVILSVVSGFKRVMFPIAVLAAVVSVGLPVCLATSTQKM